MTTARPAQAFTPTTSHDPLARAEGRLIIEDDFLAEECARRMRADIVRHFSYPETHRTGHQIWNYWHVPGYYTYLRTDAHRVIARELVAALRAQISEFIQLQLGCEVTVHWPHLSIYTNGMGQCWHNDVGNGLMGWVYSLTEHPLEGGNTLVWRGETRTDKPLVAAALHHVIEPRFNRLIVFDDRLPHAVSPVQGGLDPLRGRAVLHAHLAPR
jgi:hypothetical protein